MNPEDPRHGTANGYRNQRCRCVDCTVAWRTYYTAWREGRRSQPWPASVQHGTCNAYINYSCRCDLCKAANSAYSRDYAERLRA